MNEEKPSLLKNTNLLDDLMADPFGEKQEAAPSPLQSEKRTRLIDVIPEENREKAYQLAKQIDPANHQAMISYGTPAQSKLLTFSHTMLEHVQKKDVGEVGTIINDLMKKFNDVNPDELKPEKSSFLRVCLERYPVLFRKSYPNTKKRVLKSTASASNWKEARMHFFPTLSC